MEKEPMIQATWEGDPTDRIKAFMGRKVGAIALSETVNIDELF